MSNIRVAVRVRPLNEKEKEDGSKEIVGVKRNTISIENIKVLGIPEFGDSRSRIKEFTFDHCYDSMQAGTQYSTQAQVFDDLGTEVLKAAYDGFNACVFAYGQTGTGKTHTMMGYQNDPGLIPRICEGLFSHVGDEHTTPLITCRVDISYFEIYNERVRDLLQPEQFQQNPKFSLKVRNHPREGPYVEGLSWHRVKNNAEIQNLIDRGNEYRVTAETYIHDRSSRSHAIVTVCFTQARLEQNRPSEIVSKINLVDLAGSERADPSSKPDFRKRLTEGANINRSLVTLGYIIKALAERSLLSWDSDDMGSLQNFNSSGGGESLSSNSPSGPNKQRLPFIPYRDSVLTWLLKDSLGGNSKTIMIATITPASQFYNESISTLRYAQRAKNIVNKPRINEDGNVALIRELRREIERLQEMLADAKKGGNLLSLPDSEDSIIAEKLHENEEMAKQLTESWMCKWSSTHDIMKESDLSIRGLRNQASSMGVMIDSQLPYLIGMDDDVLSTGVVIFHLKEGETYVGRDNAEKPQDIVLIGPNILTEHCIIKHQHGEVVLYPNPGSMCSVQDQECTEPTKLSQGDYVILGGDQVFRFNNPKEAAKLREHRRSQGSLNTLSTSHLSFGGLSRASSYSSIGGDDPNCLSPYSQLGRSYPNSRRHSDIMILELEKKNQSEQERIDLARQELEKLREEHERAEDLRQEKEEQMYAQHEQHKQDLEDQKIHLARLIAENERAREKAEEELTHARESLAREKEAFQKELDAERRRLKELEKEGQKLESSGFQTDSPSTRSTTTSVGADDNDDDDARHIDTDGQPTRSKVPRQMSVEDQLKELEENEFTRRMSYRETEQSLSIQEEDIEDQYLQTQEQIQAKIKQIKEIEEEYKELDKVHLQEINSQAERLKEFQKKEAQLEIYIQEKEELINVSSGVPTHLRSASSELFLAAGQTLEVPDDSEQKTSSLQNVQSGLREDSDLTTRALQRSDSSESLEEETTDMNVGKTMEDKKNPKPKTDFKISTAARDVTSRLYKPPEPKFKYVPKTKEKEVKPAARTRVTRDRDVEPHSRGSPSRVLRDHSKGNSPSPQRHLGKQHSPSPARDKGPAGNKGNTQHKGTNNKSDRDQQGKGGVKKDQKPPVNVKSRTLSPKTAKSPERSNDLSSVSGRLGSSGKIRQMASASNLASVPESLSEGNEDTGPEQQDPKPVIKRRNRRGRADWDDEFRTHSAPDSQSMADALDKYTAQMNAQPIPGLATVDTVIPSFQTSISVDESQLSANQNEENDHEQKSFEIETESGIDVNSDNKSDTNETIDTQIYNDDVVILSGNLRNNQQNASEIVELETQTIPVDVTNCNANDDQEMDTCDKVVLGKRDYTPDVSDTDTDHNQDIIPTKVPKSSENERLSRSLSCSDDSLDVSSDSLEKESGNKHNKNKQNKRLTQSLPAYFFDNQKPSSEESFNDSLEDQNNTEKREIQDKATCDKSKFDAENVSPDKDNQQAIESNEHTGDNLDGKDVCDKDNVNISPVKKTPNLTFSQTVCHDNIDSLEQEKLSNNKLQEKGTQSLDQDGIASGEPITFSVNSQSVSTETNDDSEIESQGNDLVMENNSELVSNDSSKSNPKFELAEENVASEAFSAVDSQCESVTDNAKGKSDEETINVKESNDKSLVGKSNTDTESEYSNLGQRPTEVSQIKDDQTETSKGEKDTFLNSDKMFDVRKYVEQVVAGAHEQIYDSNTNGQESKVNDTTSEVIDDDQNKVIDNLPLHEPNDSDMQKLKTQVLDSDNSKQKLSETRTDHTDMDKPLEDHLDSAPRVDDHGEDGGHTKPGVFTDTNNNLATEDTVQTVEPDMPVEAQLDEEMCQISESMTNDAGVDIPPTRTIGICTSPDLMSTMERDDDSDASLTDPDAELQVLQDALDQLPKTNIKEPSARTIGICTSPDLMSTLEGDDDSNASLTDPDEELQVLQDALDQLPKTKSIKRPPTRTIGICTSPDLMSTLEGDDDSNASLTDPDEELQVLQDALDQLPETNIKEPPTRTIGICTSPDLMSTLEGDDDSNASLTDPDEELQVLQDALDQLPKTKSVKIPPTRTIGVCTSPDLMSTLEGGDDSDASLTDPDEELQVLQDALDQLPKVKPAPPGPQLSTARRAARQRAMIRQKQRAGDSDGIGHLSDESPGKGYQSTQAHRPDSGSRRRKRPSANKNSRVNTDHTSDDYDSSENDSTYSNDSVDNIRGFENQNGITNVDLHVPERSDNLFTTEFSDIDGARTSDRADMSNRHLRRRHDRNSPRPPQQNVESVEVESADGSSRSVGVQTFGRHNRGFSSSSLRTDVSDPDNSFASGEFGGMVMSPVSVWNSNDRRENDGNSSSSSGIIRTLSDFEKSLSQTQRSNTSIVSQGSNLDRGTTEVWSSSTSDLRPVPAVQDDMSYVMETELMCPGASSLEYADQLPNNQPLAIPSSTEDDQLIKRPDCSTPRSGRNVSISFPEQQVQQVANIDPNTPVTFEVTIHEDNTNIQYNVEKTEYKTYALRNQQEPNREPGIIPDSIHVNITENVISKTQEKVEVVKTESVNLAKDSASNTDNADLVVEKSYKASYSSEHAMGPDDNQTKKQTSRHEEVEESKNYILPAHAREQAQGGTNHLQASGVIGATSYDASRPDQDPDSNKCVDDQLNVSDCTSDYGTITSIDGRKGLVSFSDSENDSLLAGSPPASPHLSLRDGVHSENIVPATEVLLHAPQQANAISPEGYRLCSTENIEEQPMAVTAQTQMTVPSEVRSQLYSVRHGHIDGDDYFEQAEEIHDDLRLKRGDSSDEDVFREDQNDSKDETDSGSLSTVRPNSTIASQETLTEERDEIEKPKHKSNTNNDEAIKPSYPTVADTFENDKGALNYFESQRNHKPSYSSTDDSFLSLEQSETSSNASDYATPVQSPRDFNVEEDMPKNVEDVVIPDNVSSNMALCTTPRMENVDLFHDSNPVTTSSPKRPTNVRTVSVNTETSPGPTTPSASTTAKPAFSSSNDPDTIEAFRKELKRKIANIQHQHRSLSDSAISSDFTDGDSSSLSPRSSKHYEFDRASIRDQQGRPIPLELPSQLIAPGPAAENAPLNDSGNVYDQEQDTDKMVDNSDQVKDNDFETKPVSVQDRQTLVPSHVVMKFPDSIVDAALAIKPFPVKRSRSLDSIATLVNTGTTQSRALRESPEQDKYDTFEKDLNMDENIRNSLLKEDGMNSLNCLNEANEANKENVPPGKSNVISAKSTSCTDLQDNRTREYHRSLSEGNIEDFDNSHDSSADSNESITFVFVGKDELDDRRPGDEMDVENEQPEFSHSENTDRNTEKAINISGRGHDSSGSVENHDSVRSRSMSHGSLNLSDDENDDSSHSASEEIEEIIRGNKVENLQNTQEQSRDESGDRSVTNESESMVENRYRMLPNEDTSPLRHRFGIDEKILPISERSVSADNIPKQMTGYKDIQKSRSTGMLDVGVIDEPESESDIFPPAPISYDDDRTDPSFSLRTQSDGGLDQISQRTVSEIGASLSNQSSGLSTSTSNSMSSARVRSVCSVASLSSEASYEEIVISYSNGKDGSKRKRMKQGPGSTSSEGEVNVETLEDRQAHIKHVLETVEKFILPKPKLVDKGVSTEDQEGPTYKSTAMQTSLTDLCKIDEAQDETDIVRQTVLPALAAPFRAQSMDSFGLGAGIHPLQLSDGAVSWVKMSELMVETTDLLRKINARLPEMERNSSLSSTEDGQAILQQWQEISRQADRSLPNGQSALSQNQHLPDRNSAEGSNTSNDYTQVDVQYRLGFLDHSHVITSEVLSESSQVDSCEVSIQTEPDQSDDLSHLNQVQEGFVTQSRDNKTQSVPYSVLKDTSSKHVESGPQNVVHEAGKKINDSQSTNKKSDGTFIAQVKAELGMHMNSGNNNSPNGNHNEEDSLQHTQEESPVIQGIIQQNTREIEELKKEHQKLMENLKKASEKRQNRKDTIISRKKVNDDHVDEENALNKDMNNSNNTAMDDLLHEEISQVGPGMFINPDGCRVALPNTHEKQNDYTSNRNQKAPEKNHTVNADNENQSKYEEGNNNVTEYEEIIEVSEIGPGMFVNSDGTSVILPTRPATEQHSTAQNDTSSRESPLPIASTTIDKFQDTLEENETDRFEEIIEICEVGPGMFVNSDGSSAVLPTKPYSEEQREDVDARFGEETRTQNSGMKAYEKDHRSTSQGSSNDKSREKEEECQEIIEIQEVGPGMFVNSDGSNAVLPENPSSKSDNDSLPKTNDRNSSQQMEEDSSKPTNNGVLEQNIALSKSSSKDESFEFEETVIYEVGPGKFFNEDLSEAVLPSHQELNPDANNSSMSDTEDYDINNDPSVESKRSKKAEDTNNVNKNKGSKAIPEDGNSESMENNIPMDNNKNGVKEDQIMPVKSEEEDSVPEKIGLDKPDSPESNPSFNQLIEDSLLEKDEDVHIEITETGPGVFINDNHDGPQSGWIVGPGSYIPQQDGPGDKNQTRPQILHPDDSDNKQSEKPGDRMVNPKKEKDPDTDKPTSTESPEDNKLPKEEKPKGKRHEHTWQLKDNEVIAISDERPVSSSSSSRWRSDSEASLSSVGTANSDEVASVMEGKHRKSISNESPVEADLSGDDDVLAKHSTPVNKEHNSTQEEDDIMPVLHSKSNTTPTKLMKKLHEDGSVDKTDGDGKPVLPDAVGSKSQPRKPAITNSQHATNDEEVGEPCKEEGHDSDNPSDISVSTVNESFTETIETKPEMVPVLTDANNQEIVFQKSDPVLANSPEFYPSDDKKDTQASFVPIGTEGNQEHDTSLDTVNESFTEVVESKPESAPSFNGVLKASQGSDPMQPSTDKSCEAKPVHQQTAPRFGKSDDATQVSMEFSDDFTQTDDGALVAETGISHQPESRKTATPLQSGVRTQKPDNSQIKSGSGKLKDDLEKLQQERLHILDLLGMSYLPTSLTVELLEAKLNYCIGQTDLLLESVEEEFTSTDTTRPYTREQQRAVDYISKYRADLKKSKQDIQECREKLNHRTGAGIGRGRTHVRKRDVYNRERQAFIDAFKLERLREQQDYERSRHGTPVRGNTPLKGNTPLMGNSPVVTPRSEASRSSSPTYIPGYMTPREHKDHLVDLRRQLIRDIAEEEYYHRSISPRHTQPLQTLQTSPPPHHRYRSSPDTYLGYSPQVAVSLTESPDRSHPVCNTYIVAQGSHSLSAVPRSVSLDGIRPHSYHTSPSPPRHGLGPHTYHTSPSPPRHPLGHHARHLSPPSTFDTRMTAESIYSPQESAQIYREIEEMKKRSPNMSAPLEEMLRRSSFSSSGSHRSSSSRAEVGLSPRTQSDPRLTRPRHHSPDTHRYDNPLSLNLDSLQDDTQGPYSPYSAYAREHIIPNERSTGGVLRGTYQLYEDRSDTSSNHSYGSDTHSDSGHYHGLDEDTLKRLRPVRSSDIKARIGRHKR